MGREVRVLRREPGAGPRTPDRGPGTAACGPRCPEPVSVGYGRVQPGVAGVGLAPSPPLSVGARVSRPVQESGASAGAPSARPQHVVFPPCWGSL